MVGVELRASASCPGVRGRGRSIVTTSTTRPGRGLITATTSERKTASAMPCVTISVVAGFSVQIRSSSTFSRCRVMSSSAPNGSSSSITDGLTTRQRAIATRCRMPPDSWAGLAFSKPCSPTRAIRSSISPGSGRMPGHLERHPDVALDRPPGQQRGVLEGDAEVVLALDLPGRHPVDQRGAGRRRPPARRGCAGSSTCRSPDGPSSDRNVPCAVPRSVGAQRVHLVAPEGERLAQALEVEPGRRLPGRRPGHGWRAGVPRGAGAGESTPTSCAWAGDGHASALDDEARVGGVDLGQQAQVEEVLRRDLVPSGADGARRSWPGSRRSG